MSDTIDILEKTGTIALVKDHLVGIIFGAGIMVACLAVWGVGNYATASQLHAVESQSVIEIKRLEKARVEDYAALKAFILEQQNIVRKERADDEIFAIDLKRGKLSPEDSALRNRYERRLAELK